MFFKAFFSLFKDLLEELSEPLRDLFRHDENDEVLVFTPQWATPPNGPR